MEAKQITLSDGRVAEVRRLKGRDIKQALRNMNGDSSKFVFEKLALATTIDGKPIVVEDLDEMWEDDVMKLMEASGENFTSLAPNT